MHVRPLTERSAVGWGARAAPGGDVTNQVFRLCLKRNFYIMGSMNIINLPPTKKCMRCHEEKPTEEFYIERARKDGRDQKCKDCQRFRRRARRAHKYGLRWEWYLGQMIAQNGRCLICNQKAKETRLLTIDHDHKTGKVRGLLCDNCNTGLGLFKDSPNLLRRAALYLENTAQSKEVFGFQQDMKKKLG